MVRSLDSIFPNSSHVFFLGLDQVPDSEVWEFARDNKFILVTKDADFGDLSILRGFPPKVVWIRRGNCKTIEIEDLLRKNFDVLAQLESDEVIGVIPLF